MAAVSQLLLNGRTVSVDLRTPLDIGEMFFEGLVLRFAEFISGAELRSIAEAVYRSRELWRPAYGNEQFSIGEVWYHYRETGQLGQYAIRAVASRRDVERVAPGLTEHLLNFIARLSGKPAALRQGWAGPAIVIFPAGEKVAKSGGPLHYDWDGLSPLQLADPELQAFTLLIPVQVSDREGRLVVHAKRYDPASSENIDEPAVSDAGHAVDYVPGELCLIHSLQAHSIEPFKGTADRIMIVAHSVLEDSRWVVWF